MLNAVKISELEKEDLPACAEIWAASVEATTLFYRKILSRSTNLYW